METAQPVYIDEYGTFRFFENKIVSDISNNNLNEICSWRHYDKSLSLDDMRQFYQLIGYSLSGFADLQICYESGFMTLTEDNDYDHNYVNYIFSLDVLESKPEYHYPQLERENGYYKPNTIVQKIVEYYEIDVDELLNNRDYQLHTRRHFAQLLGFKIDDIPRKVFY